MNNRQWQDYIQNECVNNSGLKSEACNSAYQK